MKTEKNRQSVISLLHLTMLIVVSGLFLPIFAQQKNPGQSVLHLKQHHVPLFVGRDNSNVIEIHLQTNSEHLRPVSVALRLTDDSHLMVLDSVRLFRLEGFGEKPLKRQKLSSIGGEALQLKFDGLTVFPDTAYCFAVDFVLKGGVLLEKSFALSSVEAKLSDGKYLLEKADSIFRYRPALVLRAAGQDHCHTYRIPGIVTTNTGTLIAVYDARFNNSKDLQEDIDIGMSRSTDGGQHWEAMKVVMDMGEWGGRPQNLNGVGDPSILYDPVRHTLWVAALWLSGSQPDKALWWESQPGIEPHETGQFMLVKSTDDGLSWSQPINITRQVKDPAWQLLLAGPGRGITLDDGALVFPAQFKSDLGVQAIDGGKFTCQSTIVFSRDGGLSWNIGTGAKPNTTESQVVQLRNGALMLNMRDDLNRRQKGDDNGRAVALSHDMGNSWTLHPSSNHALIEPNCMASLINVKSGIGSFLLFSNPADVSERRNMTVKASFDEGLSWPEEHQILLNENPGFGYSCLTQLQDGAIGIVYEGISELFFQKIPLNEFLRNK